jgi:hypothetical protein
MGFPSHADFSKYAPQILDRVQGMKALALISHAGIAAPPMSATYRIFKNAEGSRIRFSMGIEIQAHDPSLGAITLLSCKMWAPPGATLTPGDWHDRSFSKGGVPHDRYWYAPVCHSPGAPALPQTHRLAQSMKSQAAAQIESDRTESLARVVQIFSSNRPLSAADRDFIGRDLSHAYGLGYAIARIRELAQPISAAQHGSLLGKNAFLPALAESLNARPGKQVEAPQPTLPLSDADEDRVLEESIKAIRATKERLKSAEALGA